MENDGQYQDAILQLMRYMSMAEILAFGATNVRNRWIVSNYIVRRQANRGPIEFHLRFPLAALNEILVRFGEHFQILSVYFGQRTIDMRVFRDRNDTWLIENAELTMFGYVNETTVRVAVGADSDDESDDDGGSDDDSDGRNVDDYETDGYYYFNIEQLDLNITHMLQQFQRNAEQIIVAINNHRIGTLQQLSFRFGLGLSPAAYNRLHVSFDDHVIPVTRELFGGLRRGNMNFEFTPDFMTYSFEFILEFNL